MDLDAIFLDKIISVVSMVVHASIFGNVAVEVNMAPGMKSTTEHLKNLRQDAQLFRVLIAIQKINTEVPSIN